MILGFVAYGLSINFYILAQKDLGAAKTSGYYAIAPFLGVLFSMVLLRELPAWNWGWVWVCPCSWVCCSPMESFIMR